MMGALPLSLDLFFRFSFSSYLIILTTVVIACTIGYISTLAAWLGGMYVNQNTDVSLLLHWLSEAGPEYLESKQRNFVQEVRKKQKRYGNTQGDESEEAS